MILSSLYLVSQKYPKCCYKDAFNKMLPRIKESILGSVNGLCEKAISVNLMTHEEKAGILVDNNKYEQASRFLDNFAPKVDPQVLALLMNMLSGLGLTTCDQIVLGISKCRDSYRGGGEGGLPPPFENFPPPFESAQVLK